MASRDIPRGRSNVAKVPAPSKPPATPFPASVETALVEVLTTRILLLIASTTYSSPLGCHAAEVGHWNCAKSPLALSAKPATPLPANEDTTAVESTMLRILLPCCSTMYPTAPVASNAISVGYLNCATVPIPLPPPPVPLPARVVTRPEGRILRTR